MMGKEQPCGSPPTESANLFARLRARILRDERGQALVEFAILFPVFALLLFGMLDFGAAYNDHNDMTHLAGAAVRYAAVDNCGSSCTDIATQVKTEASNDGLVNGSGGVFGTDQPLRICFWYPPPTGSGPPGSGAEGDPVQAIVETNYQLFPFLGLSFTKVKVRATATMRIETAASGSGDVYTTDSGVSTAQPDCADYTG